MNKIVREFILAADKFVQEMHLKQPGFSCSDCGSFTKNKERIEKFKHAEVQILFAKTILIKLVFNKIWLIANQKIEQEELNQIKFKR